MFKIKIENGCVENEYAFIIIEFTRNMEIKTYESFSRGVTTLV